ncbi:MAG: DUF2244 domain-containing protein [Pseudomonadota bacterium]|nr:DUF2244 domain-containing protein [Pseudomonadota bacterium]
MTQELHDAQGPAGAEPQFSALLVPHRSLSPRGFVILMAAIGLVSFAAGTAFLLLGAWPVLGFFGLDVLLIWWAFRVNYRAARLYETVDLTAQSLTVTRVQPSGRRQAWKFNPYWVRLEILREPGRACELALSSHGRKLLFGRFLSDPEKLDFAGALTRALGENRSARRT